MDVICNIDFQYFIERATSAEVFNNELMISDLSFMKMNKCYINMPAVRVDALMFFLCLQGEILFSIDYKTFQLTAGMLLQINKFHLLNSIDISNLFEGHVLIMSPKLVGSVVREVPAIKTMSVHFKRAKPAMELDSDKMRYLMDIVMRMKALLRISKHAFRDHILRNEASSFLLEVLNISLEKMVTTEINANKNGKSEILQQFACLVFQNCKEQHEVSFYAKELCMTSGNLSRIIKTLTGKTTMKWISEALIAEAKVLLHRQEMNIQQIADELHFSNQSSFGKFFKKHTGLSPVEYRNRIDTKSIAS